MLKLGNIPGFSIQS